MGISQATTPTFETLDNFTTRISNASKPIQFKNESPRVEFKSNSRNIGTKLFDSMDKRKPKAVAETTTSKILSDIKGVILAVRKSSVDVKLKNDLLVAFPIQLFKDNDLIKVGQQLKYQIKTDQWGYKCQDFVKDESVGIADISELEEIMKNI